MSNFKVALFDVDGVLNRQPEFFSRRYAREQGLDTLELESFFDDEFEKASLGKADLLELVVARKDLWRWEKAPELLLAEWFKTENHPDEDLLKVVKDARHAGIKAYLATQQEKYRTAYIKEVMYPGLFDGHFISCELGYLKSDPAFFQIALQQLQAKDASLSSEQIAYFDDRQNLVDVATSVGIKAFLYENPDQVRSILDA